MKKFTALISLFGSLAVYATIIAAPVDFSRDIRPILSDKCFSCHGPNESDRQADFRLDLKDSVFADREGHAAVVPGQLDKSEIVSRITSTVADEMMPPPDSGKSLTADEIELIKRWISEGAEWKEHWSLISPRRPNPPAVNETSWLRNPIDSFVWKRLRDEGLAPEAEADRRTLIRRLCLDLTGLPPTPDQIHGFLNDASSDAYERLVDELLKSKHFGERMTVAWLDQARYADTNGYSIDGGRHMWLWRDWVIHAYNENMPFDQFAVEQLAGDLLPNSSIDQRVATGFNRNHMITHEGGTIPEENLVNYAADRVRTTAEVFLGLTMGCAQCHDHKFDPISQKDYYRFFAYFNGLEDRGLDGDGGVNSSPRIKSTSILGRDSDEVPRIRDELARLEERMHEPLTSQAAWEASASKELASLGRNLVSHPVKVLKVTTPNRGTEYEVREDGTIFDPTADGRSASVSLQIDQENVAGIRIVFLPDERFPDNGLGYGSKGDLKGSFVLTSFSASATSVPSDQVDLYRLIPIQEATASTFHPDYPPNDCLNSRDETGWSPGGSIHERQHITFRFQTPINHSETAYVTLLLVWGGGRTPDRSLIGGKYQAFVITGNDDGTNIPVAVRYALSSPLSHRSAEQLETLRAHHAQVAPELTNVRYQIQNLKERLQHLTDPFETMVMNVAKRPRETFVLNRGQYDQPTEAVSPATPACLPPQPADSTADRLGLAKWLFAKDHPLTSRVAVNRLWQLLFGEGIVASSADFGSQGDPPSHPELLDWLAVEFVESGWNVKHSVKLMVMSATYRQQSTISPAKLEIDPGNRLLTRGPRFRLPAEFVRDAMLRISGLLVDRVGGPSVNPYQPGDLWREVSHFGSTPATAQAFIQDHGERLYRRGMYTYWKRTLPPPSMVSFDAPNREICTVQRLRTNTPLQALVLLNDPQYIEASRAFATSLLRDGPSNVDQRILLAFERAIARPPSERELAIVRRTYQRELIRFQADRSAAVNYLGIGEADNDPRYDVAEHATWAIVCGLILNLSETITRG